MLYSAKDLKTVRIQMFVNGGISLVIFVLSIIFGYIAAMNASEAVGTVILCVGLCLFIFVLGNFALPCYYYYRYLLDLFTGRYVKRSGTVMSVGAKPKYKDNKNYYYEIELDFGNGYNALFLYDANLGVPDMHEGDKRTLVSFENFIVKVENC